MADGVNEGSAAMRGSLTWIPVSERLPDIDECVLIFRPYIGVEEAKRRQLECFFEHLVRDGKPGDWEWEDLHGCNVSPLPTHWAKMPPLPVLPTDAK